MKRGIFNLILIVILLSLSFDGAADTTASVPKTVLVPLAETFEDTEAIPIISILRRAGAEVTVASLGKQIVSSTRGLKVIADKKLADCGNDKFDLIVLPGGMPAAQHLHDSKILKRLLIEQNQHGKLYAAICASPIVVLSPHGLLNGKRATCYPSMFKSLADSSEANKRVVVDGNCITSQGPGTAMEFALKLVESLYGTEKAEKLKKGYLVR